MLKIYLKIFFILICVKVCFSQGNKSGEVIYKKSIEVDLENDFKHTPEDQIALERTKSLIENLEKIEYSLKFNKNESVFEVIEVNNESINGDTEIAVLVGGGNGVYYINEKENEIIHQKNSFGTDYLVVNKLDNLKWNIGDDIKLVGKYACLKATTTIKRHTRNVIENQKVVAWFCPKIKFNTGPIGFGGLPGMILELQKGKFKFTYHKLDFSEEFEEIKKPEKGKMITNEELLEISQKHLENN